MLNWIPNTFKSKSFLKYFFNTGWLIGRQFAKLVVGLFVGIWVTRYLGPERFGIYSYAISFSVFFQVLASLGLNHIVVRDLVRYTDKLDVLLGTTYWVKLFGSFGSLALSVIVLLLLPNLESELKLYIFILVFGTAFSSLQVIDFYFQAKVESKYTVIASLVTVLLTAAIKIVLILLKAPLIAFVCVAFFSGLSLGLGYLYFYKKKGLSVRTWKFDRKLAKSLLSESWPLILSGLSISIGMRIDQIMLKDFVGMENLGIYATGVRLAEILVFLPGVISQSIFPKIVSFDLDLERHKIITIIRYIFFLLCLMALVITLFSKYIVVILYGAEFMPAYKVLQILIWTIPVTYLGIITNQLLNIKSHQKIVFWKQFILLVFNVALNLILIPKYGIIGAAWATLIADICINLFLDLAFKKTKWIFKLKLSALLLVPTTK